MALKSLIFIITTFSFLAVITCNCNSITGNTSDSLYMDYDHVKVPYKLYSPDSKYSLHYDLEEISGLSMMGNDQLAAVEDERGYVYILNAKDGEVVRKIKFAKGGDYEGVEIIDNVAYIVKSNGDLFSFTISDMEEVEADEVDTELSSANDVEGLAFIEGELVLACKAKGEVNDNKVKGKAVYSYDLKKRKLVTEKLFNISEEEIDAHISNRKFFNKINNFDPSAIAVHPLTSDVYLLSADKVLVVLTPDYQISEVVRLDGGVYRQPEGICFSKDGTLYISSEGGGARGKIFQINYKP